MATTKISWSTDEWHTFALNLLAIHPAYLTMPRLPLRASDMRAAMASFPVDRQRPVIEQGGKNDYQKKLLTIYTFFRSKQTADLPVPVLVPVPTDTEGQVVADVAKKIPQYNSKIRWSSAEWFAIAKEMLRIRPHERLLTSTTLAGLRTPDLQAAQRCLPADRQRTAMFNPVARRKLLEAFATLRTISAPEVAVPVELSPPAPIAPLPNAWEAACAPLFSLFAERLADVLLPRLAELLRQPVASGRDIKPDELNTVFSAAVSSLGQTQQSTIVRSRRIKIGIAGPLPIQAQDIAAEFPQFDVLYHTEGSHGIIAKMSGVDRMIGMVGKMSHSTDNKLSTHFKERYCRVNGGKSMITRQIRLWIANGVLS